MLRIYICKDFENPTDILDVQKLQSNVVDRFLARRTRKLVWENEENKDSKLNLPSTGVDGVTRGELAHRIQMNAPLREPFSPQVPIHPWRPNPPLLKVVTIYLKTSVFLTKAWVTSPAR